VKVFPQKIPKMTTPLVFVLLHVKIKIFLPYSDKNHGSTPDLSSEIDYKKKTHPKKQEQKTLGNDRFNDIFYTY
jgi:hypothetical protein